MNDKNKHIATLIDPIMKYWRLKGLNEEELGQKFDSYCDMDITQLEVFNKIFINKLGEYGNKVN